MRVLLIRFSSLGDIVLSLSAAHFFKQQFPEAKLSFLSSKEGGSIVRNCPDVDETIAFDRRQSLLALWQLIRKEHRKTPFDIILDLHSSLRSSLGRWALWHVPRWTIDKRRWERWFLRRFKISLLRSKSQARFLDRLYWDGKMLWPEAKKSLPLMRLNFAIDPFAGEASALKNHSFGVVLPAAAHDLKRFPIECFKQIISFRPKGNQSFQWAVLGGANDVEFQTLQGAGIINLVGKLSLDESMALVGKSQLVVGNDTGLIHAAEAQNVAVVTLFGPTHPDLGFAPHLPKSRYFSPSKLFCHPCTLTGKGSCWRSEQFCLQHVSGEGIQRALTSVLEKS